MSFSAQRLQVRLLSTGHVMLFDVTAVETENASLGPLEIVFPESNAASEAGLGRAGPLGPVALTRFVAQQLYAPQRVLREVPGIRRVPMGTPETVSLYRSDQVIATPLGSWQGGGLYVTVVKLTHTGHERLILDPRLLKGRFVSATFQHNSLGPAGSSSDTTCVYLVTQHPFIASIFLADTATPSQGD
jgi:integrating conjugative element protein (TIGR03749 family)